MATKMRAVKSTMSFGIIMTQFILGLKILADIFSSNKVVDMFLENSTRYQNSRGLQAIEIGPAEAPIRFLFAVLGFMIFSYILMMIAPMITGRKQRAE